MYPCRHHGLLSIVNEEEMQQRILRKRYLGSLGLRLIVTIVGTVVLAVLTVHLLIPLAVFIQAVGGAQLL